MAHGISTRFNVVIASGVSTSNEMNLGRGWRRVIVDPTGVGGSISFQAAPNVLNVAGTYRTVSYEVTSGMSAPQAVTVGSAMSGSYVPVLQLQGVQFMKIFATGTVANGVTIPVICSDQ